MASHTWNQKKKKIKLIEIVEKWLQGTVGRGNKDRLVKEGKLSVIG